MRQGARAALSALAAASVLAGCAHGAGAVAAKDREIRQLQNELRRLRAEREQDRRTIRALEAQLATMKQRWEGERATGPAEPSRPGAARVEAESVPRSPRAAAEAIVILEEGPAGALDPYLLGLEALERGDAAEAIRHLEGSLHTNPHHPSADRATLALGEAWLALAKPGRALASFERVITEYPTASAVPQALLRYGETCQKLGRVAAARAAFRRLVEDHPTSSAAGRAQAHLATR